MIFRNWVLQNFPFLEDDFDALTDYELFCKMVEYMKKSLDKINEYREVLNGYQDELNDFRSELDSYKEYFDNLDVQEEINNKLDEMADSGELTDIIAQYLGLAGVLAFNTVSDMVEAENLVNGSICRTLGQNTYNDGKGYFYKVRTITNDDVIDGLNIIALDASNTLIAERIFNALIDKSNPIYYGADPTGTVDSSLAIQNCLDANINKEVVFTCGIYIIEHPIEISYNNQFGGINFNNSVIIDETNGDYSIGIGTKDHNMNQSNNSEYLNKFYNVTNLKINTNSDYAILIDRWFLNTRLDNIDIMTSKNGIQIGKLYDGYDNKPADVQMTNFIVNGTNMNDNYEGISIIGSDSKFNNGRIYGFKTGINANSNLLQLENVQFLACNFGDYNLDNSYICIKNAGTLLCDMCYCDSYPCFIKPNNNTCDLSITNLFVFSWHNKFTESSLFDFSDVSVGVPSINYKNIHIDKSNYPNSMKIIELSSDSIINGDLYNGFNSEGNIRITDINSLTDAYKDLSLSKRGYYTNNYWSSWVTNWLPIGHLNIINSGSSFMNIFDNDLGLITFKIDITNKVITSCSKLSQSTSGYDPALAFKLIDGTTYKVYYAKNKSDLTQSTYTNIAAELIKGFNCYITPIILDNYNQNAVSESTVDIIST